VKNTLTAFGAQTRFVEEVTWSKHPKPAIRRSNLRAAEKVPLLPSGGLFCLSRSSALPDFGTKFRARPKFDARTVIGTSFVATHL
jgi:hypothetical protein